MRRKTIAIFSGIVLAVSCNISSYGIYAAEGDTKRYGEPKFETDWNQIETESETEWDQIESESEAQTEEADESENIQTEPEEPESELETEPETKLTPMPETVTDERGPEMNAAESETETEETMLPETTPPQPAGELEPGNGAEQKNESETEIEKESKTVSKHTETDTDSETEIELETEAEQETEYPKEKSNAGADDSIWLNDSAIQWDPSWYIQEDFRFTQVDKEYVLIEGGADVYVYDQPDKTAKVVGEIPYFGLAYVLEGESGGWVYIESGGVRGFVPADRLSDETYAAEIVHAIGEEAFRTAEMYCEKPDNGAFTYTKTTVQDVLADKQYAILLYSGSIQEYANIDARAVGTVHSGNLVYVLEPADNGWVFVESGDVRGFLPKDMLLTGGMADDMVMLTGEDIITLADPCMTPSENRNCYYSLKSVKAASESIGEQIAEYAVSFVGRLEYIYGGTSLKDGADCSGFTQAVFANFGVNIPRLAEDQGVNGEYVSSLQEAQPGDIVYWADSPHVGIYIGNGKVVHCSGGRANTHSNPGRGPIISDADYRSITAIRRYLIKLDMGNNHADATVYTQAQLELIWAIVAQEDNGSYEGALAVISSAMNRTESPVWRYCGSTALAQLTAPGQYCYSNDNYWKARLNRNVPDYVVQAVEDCLKRGIRNHPYTSFRSRKGAITGQGAVQIGGNWFFGT